VHVFTATVGTGDAALAVLVVQHSAGQSLEAMFETLYTDYAEARQQAACVIVRPDVRDRFVPVDLAAAVSGARPASPFLDALCDALSTPDLAFARMPDMPIAVLHTSGEALHLSANINPAGTDTPFESRKLDENTILSALRERELSCLVERSRALWPMIPGSFYRAPSRRLARAFLRVGNIQFSRHAIDSVCFWLLPHMHDCTAILVDTWSISSIAFDLAGLVGDAWGIAPLPVEMLSEYQDGSTERMAVAAEALDRLSAELDARTEREAAENPAKVACILSATHSGSLIGVLNDLLTMSDFSLSLSYVAIFQMGADLGLASLCDISGTPEFKPLDKGEESGRTIVEVDPRSYFPLTHNDVERVIRIRHTQTVRAFIEAFTEPGLISLHRDHRTDGPTRHNAIHIDTEKLTRSAPFQAKFAEQLRALKPRPSVVVTPLHAAARELGQLAASILSGDGAVEHYEHSTLALDEEGPDREANLALRRAIFGLTPDEALLVLDDAFITGTRMSAYQGRLRAMGCKARLHYHVAVARPPNLANWRNAKAMLGWRSPEDSVPHARNTVDSTYELCLPNWQERECPWCAELSQYNDLVDRGVMLPAFFAARRQRLVAAKDSGLIDDALLQDGFAPPMQLEQGSIFAPPEASQAAVFASVASAFQTMRTVLEPDLPLLGPRRHPLSTVLKATDYLLDTYTDSIVRAAFLRAAVPDELVYASPGDEEKRQVLISEIVENAAAHVCDLGHELILASACGKGELSERAKIALRTHAGRREALELLQNSDHKAS
jgi:hypothetical protein